MGTKLLVLCQCEEQSIITVTAATVPALICRSCGRMITYMKYTKFGDVYEMYTNVPDIAEITIDTYRNGDPEKCPISLSSPSY